MYRQPTWWKSLLPILIIPLIYSCQSDSLPQRDDFFSQLILDTHQLHPDSLQNKYRYSSGLGKIDSLNVEMYLCLERYDSCHYLADKLKASEIRYSSLLLNSWYSRTLDRNLSDANLEYIVDKIDLKQKWYQAEVYRRLNHKDIQKFSNWNFTLDLNSSIDHIIRYQKLIQFKNYFFDVAEMENESIIISWYLTHYVLKNPKVFQNKKSLMTTKLGLINLSLLSADTNDYKRGIDLGEQILIEMDKTDSKQFSSNMLKLQLNQLYLFMGDSFKYNLNMEDRQALMFNPKLDRKILISEAFNCMDEDPKRSNQLLHSFINSEAFDSTNYYDSHFIRYALWNYQSLKMLDSVMHYAKLYHDMVTISAADDLIDLWIAKNELAGAYYQNYEVTENKQDLEQAYKYATEAYDLQYRVLMENKDVHLSDVLAINTDRLLEILEQLIKVEPNNERYKDHLLSIAQLYRDQVLQIGLLKSPLPVDIDPQLKQSLETKEKSLNRLLKDVNEFKEGLELPDPRLDTMYQLVYDIYLLKKSIPKTEESLTVNTSLIDYSNLQADLAEDSTLLLQIIASEESYWFLGVDQDRLYLEEYDKQSADSLLSLMRSTMPLKDEQVRAPLTVLYNTYFAPLLQNKDHKRLAVIPDGAFCDLPLASLIREGDYLLDDYAISYHININEAMAATERSVDLDAIDSYSYSDAKSLRQLGKKEYVELPYAMREVQYIDSSFSEQVNAYYHDQATREQFDQSISSSDIIHLASHAYSSSTNRLESYLVLRNEVGGTKKLYGYELDDESISAPLVVMSACETGAGTSYSGTGVFSLSRDFLRAGAGAVIKTNYAINDASTYKLMTHFYDYLYSLSIGDALRQAKLDLIADSTYQHPYYWSGVIMEGNDRVQFSVPGDGH